MVKNDMQSVVVSEDEYRGIPVQKIRFEEERENPFEQWLTDGKHGGALEMFDKYRMPEEKSKRLDNMKGVLV